MISSRAAWSSAFCSAVSVFDPLATCRRRWPTGGFLVSLLGVRMTQAVHATQTGTQGLSFIQPQLLDVIAVRGDERAHACQLPGRG